MRVDIMTPSSGNNERDSTVSSLYKAGDHPEPPDHFDDAILAAARKEVRAGPGRSARSGFSPWLIPLSTAAVLVLSVSMVTIMRQEQPEQFDPDRLAALEVPSEDSMAARSAAPPAAVKIKPLMSPESPALGENEAPTRKMEAERKKLEELAGKRIEEEMRRQVEEERRRQAEVQAGTDASSNLAKSMADIAPPLPQKIFDTPEEWLKEIARLRQIGEKELADDQLKQFRAKYPKMADQEIETKIEQYTKELRKAEEKIAE